ncbi:MBL fold metallo-hydrolase [Mesobacillus selenatarsenatis]|uniref:Metallo-beta-lactamase family protein n=1 Tax=Mesobacillus selenatarsenatis (strain DSM 18680 / JCM 14380 / FERM P-15431 / SF-1) TaxID=1321606 RepID=A0A0A8WYY4_MESS1|nr:MBL fold metallo-hydrolase [Mesobacillus selenatarsenatis]GAM12895.1 metallo-beta-lactamase family protein [Mesobacillus selenatarsenatis SF-1]
MNHYICNTCGVQYSNSAHAPETCLICADERQYIHPDGQSWTTLQQLADSGKYKNTIIKEEEGLYSLTTTPSFAIGQTAYLVRNDGFNLLWDCITYLDEKTEKDIYSLGGIDAIALSHPHYYSTQVEWAERFGASIYIHEADRQWVTRPSDRIIFWSGDSLELDAGITLYRLGGHFSGGSVLHWENDVSKQGVLLTGDIIQIVADRQWVSFMYSYPNLIPLPANKVQEMAAKVSVLKFDRIYNAFHRVIMEDAHQSVQNSAKRYIEALEGKLVSINN